MVPFSWIYLNWQVLRVSQLLTAYFIQDEPGDGIFTEGSFALVEGEYNEDDTLEVVAMGQPPCESRETSR